MSLICPKYFNCVVSLGKDLDINPQWIGTGFLVCKEISQNEFTIFLVTNKHVLEGLESIEYRYKKKNDPVLYNATVKLIDNGKKLYSVHPDKDVDVAVVMIYGIFFESQNVEFYCVDIDKEAVSSQEFITQGGCDGNGIFMLGYPMGLAIESSNHPICRGGCIARLDPMEINDKKNILLDIQNFPGNSGSPIFVKPENSSIQGTKPFNKSVLLGIVHSYMPYRETLISTQTKRVVEVREENSGLANANPVEYIREVIDLELQRENLVCTI